MLFRSSKALKAHEETNKLDPGTGQFHDNDDGDESVVDFKMYATMFETAMEMLETSGALKKPASAIYLKTSS